MFFSNPHQNVLWYFLFRHKNLHSIKSTLYLSPHFPHVLLSSPYLHLVFLIPSTKLPTRFDSEPAINPALSANFNLSDRAFVVSFTFLSTLLTFFFLFGPKRLSMFQYFLLGK